jgi:accessory gene regulator protein AgrB
MDKFLLWIADWHNDMLRKRGIINDANYSDIDLVFRGNMYNVIATMLFLVIGVIFNCFNEILAMFISFNIIRNSCGGWHSYGNLNLCLITSLVVFGIGVFVSIFYSHTFLFWMISSLLSIIYIFYNSPYDECGYQKYEVKFDALIISTLFFMLGYVLCRLGLNSMGISMFMGILFSALLMCRKITNFLEKLK